MLFRKFASTLDEFLLSQRMRAGDHCIYILSGQNFFSKLCTKLKNYIEALLEKAVEDMNGAVTYQYLCNVQIIDDCLFFKYLVPGGEAYDRKYKEKLREDDK